MSISGAVREQARQEKSNADVIRPSELVDDAALDEALKQLFDKPTAVQDGVVVPHDGGAETESQMRSKRPRRTTMEHFAGLDVAMEETAVCVVDVAGTIVHESTVATDPDAIAAALAPWGQSLGRAGHEAGSLSPWLQPALDGLGVPAVCLETRNVRAAMAAQRNKTDQTDAQALAQIVRTGWYREVHIKSETSYRLRLLLTLRRNLKRKFLDIENAIRHSLKSFGIRLAGTTRGHFADVIRHVLAGDTLLLAMIEPMLEVRAVMWLQYTRLHRLVVRAVRADEVCRRFMAIPGVGPIVALQVKTALDDPGRFSRSKTVGAYFGLTSRRWQTGTSIDIQGRISKMGDDDVRRALVEAANSLLLRYQGWSALKVWGLKLSKTRGRKRALVAVARKLAVIMFAMWRDGTEYRFGAQKDASEPLMPTAEPAAAAA